MPRPLLFALSLVVAACSDGPTGTASPFDAQYFLLSVDGESLPLDEPDGNILRGAILDLADGRYSLRLDRESPAGNETGLMFTGWYEIGDSVLTLGDLGTAGADVHLVLGDDEILRGPVWPGRVSAFAPALEPYGNAP